MFSFSFSGYFKFDMATMFEASLNLGCMSDGRFATGLMANISMVMLVVAFTIFQYRRKTRHIDRGADTPEEELEEMRIVKGPLESILLNVLFVITHKRSWVFRCSLSSIRTVVAWTKKKSETSWTRSTPRFPTNKVRCHWVAHLPP